MSRRTSDKRSCILFPVTLGKGAHTPLEQLIRQRGFQQQGAVLRFWQEAAGKQLAAHCRPVRIKAIGKDGNTKLLLVQTSPAYQTIIAHEAEAILQRLTTLLGYRPADRIVVVQ